MFIANLKLEQLSEVSLVTWDMKSRRGPCCTPVSSPAGGSVSQRKGAKNRQSHAQNKKSSFCSENSTCSLSNRLRVCPLFRCQVCHVWIWINTFSMSDPEPPSCQTQRGCSDGSIGCARGCACVLCVCVWKSTDATEGGRVGWHRSDAANKLVVDNWIMND